MHDEAGFLSAIRQTPADDTARLVFADWLDEQDDPACKTKAAFIRLELQMAEAPEDAPGRAESLANLRSLAAEAPPFWLAVVSHPKLEGCQRPRSSLVRDGGSYSRRPRSKTSGGAGSARKRSAFSRPSSTPEWEHVTAIVSRLCPRSSVSRVIWARSYGRSIRLTPEMIERLRNASVRGGAPSPAYHSPPPPPRSRPHR